MAESVDSFRAELRTALTNSFLDGRFRPHVFFADWFRVRGTGHYFLFKKNLTVTNLQHAELAALLRLHVRENGAPLGDELQFQTPAQFIATVRHIIECFGGDVETRVRTIIENYCRILKRTVVIRPLFGSAAVYTPPGMEIQLAQMCAYSGYIHSCGPLILLRRVDKATKAELQSSLQKHLDTDRTLPPGKKVYFVPYAHEDHDRWDEDYRADLRHGLDDVKIYVQKFFLESEPLVSVLSSIAEKLGDRLCLAQPGNPHEARHKYKTRPEKDILTDRSFWLLADHAVSDRPRTRGAHRYFVCFDQRFKNETPLHLFDEDKPAWTAPITIPHTMLGAMLNLTRPHWPRGTDAVIADPFVGTGTTVLEALKFPNTVAYGTDLEPATERLVADNHAFFGKTKRQVEALQERLAKLDKLHGFTARLFKSDEATAYQWAEGIANAYIVSSRTDGQQSVVKEFALNAELAAELEEKDEFSRFVLYMLMRAVVRHYTGFISARTDGPAALASETKRFTFLLKELGGYLQRIEASGPRSSEPAMAAAGLATDRFEPLVFEGLYSDACAVVPRPLDEKRGDCVKGNVNAFDTPLPKERFDVIVTDPPYGINTDMSAADLATLYARVIPSLVRALKPYGQIVLCLPERSYIGRNSPFFTHKELVVHQVLEASRRLGREVWVPSLAVPAPGVLYRAPYYWESERALARSILHFHIRKLE